MNNSKVRLAYLISRYPAISHTFILREVMSLRQMGFEISVASINNPDRKLSELTIEEQSEVARTYYVKNHGFKGALKAHTKKFFNTPFAYISALIFAMHLAGSDLKKVIYNFFYFVEAVMIGLWMQEENFSHLHIHFATPAATVGMIVEKLFSFTFSITVHGPDEFYDVSKFKLTEKIENSSFICCIGSYARSQLMKLSSPKNWSKFEVVPLGVDPTNFTPKDFRNESDTFELICVGRLVAAKGQQILINAFGELVKEGWRLRLRLVGDGPDRSQLEESVKKLGLEDSVIFEGAVNQDRIRDLYKQADIFALASFAEGIPVVLMEAMAMEIPCVTTFITGIPELIRDGVDGLLVPPSDTVELKGAITRLISDSNLRQCIAKAGRKRVLQKYNLNENTKLLAEVFKRRLSQKELLTKVA